MDIFSIADKIKDFFLLAKDSLISLPWPKIVVVLKSIFTVISFLLFIGVIFVIFGLRVIYRTKRTLRLLVIPHHLPKKKLVKKWGQIEKRLESGQEAELKLAVIEADKFFDNILKKIGYFGKDMGERLKKINPGQMVNINDIWSAHKIRNNIVHDVDYKLISVDAERAVGAYKKALEELEVL